MDFKEKVFWVFLKLLCEFGPQRWWPRIWSSGDFKEEVIVGAVLTQNVSWKNVEKVLKNLEKHALTSLESIVSEDESKIYEILKPAVFVSRKIKTLKEVYNYIIKVKFPSKEGLLKVYGVGEETADVILLYAYNVPVFVVDKYTERWFKRFFGFYKGDVRNLLGISGDLFYLKEFHALLDELGKRFCKKQPLCGKCPIRKRCLVPKSTL